MLRIIKIILLVPLVILLSLKDIWANEKIKIGLLVPLTGKDSEIGQSIVKSTRLAINKIDNSIIEIIPKDTKSDPEITYEKAKELREAGVKIVIGPVFNKNLVKLEELNDMIFLSLTNKIIDNPKNIISTGINAGSQLNTIAKFQKFFCLHHSSSLIFHIPHSSTLVPSTGMTIYRYDNFAFIHHHSIEID